MDGSGTERLSFAGGVKRGLVIAYRVLREAWGKCRSEAGREALRHAMRDVEKESRVADDMKRQALNDGPTLAEAFALVAEHQAENGYVGEVLIRKPRGGESFSLWLGIGQPEGVGTTPAKALLACARAIIAERMKQEAKA